MSLTTPVQFDAPFQISLDVRSLCLSDEQFFLLCRDNPELQIEVTAKRELIIMSPTASDAGWKRARIIRRPANWTEEDRRGICFDPSAGFTLPNGAVRSPDASWILRTRWQALRPEDRQGFASICPDFVVELSRGPIPLSDLQEKMEEYIENGARLGWLLDPEDRCAYVYRAGKPVERVEHPEHLSGENVLAGFQFNFQEILQEP